MSYESERGRLGRETFVQCKLILDKCENTYGVSPCTASGAAGTECYNTRISCQDTPNYNKGTTEVNLCGTSGRLPVDEINYPCITEDPKFTPTEIKPESGSSIRSKVEITIQDFTHHDRGIDPYQSTRDPVDGTFFSRLLRRNPYYIGRSMQVNTGYLSPVDTEQVLTESGELRTTEDGEARETESISSISKPVFEGITRLYLIDKIEGPKVKGDKIFYKIIGKDFLNYSSRGKALIPKPSTGVLDSDIPAGSATIEIADTATVDLSDYPSGGGTIVIGDEWMTYTLRFLTTLQVVSRGQFGTEATSHNEGDTLQFVQNFTGNPVAIIDEILDDFTEIDGDSYIPYDAGKTSPTGTDDEWDIEEDTWLPGINLDAYVGEPTDASELINQICRSFQIDVWWSDDEQKVKLKVNAPPLANSPVTELNDQEHLISESISVKELPDDRISRVVFSYDRINYSESDKVSNFARHHFQTNTEAENSDLYNEVRVKSIKSRWLTSTQDGSASQTAQRLLDRFSDTPIEIKFMTDMKDANLSTGDLCDITTKHVQDFDGSPRTLRFQVISAREVEQGHSMEYKALIQGSSFTARNAFVASNSIGDYDSATENEKVSNAFIGPNSGLFSDGGELYKVI